jgi:SAM-dependent methyltransferase
VDTVAPLRPGRALDLGCGEGADSVWLAEHGWQVTAVDVSATAIGRARALAAEHAVPGGQITWHVADLGGWQPAGRFDLVSACFLHAPVEFPRATVLQRAAGAVAAGGHLLIVGHAEAPPWSADHDHDPHRFLSPEAEIAALALDPPTWAVVIAEIRSRQAVSPDGGPVTLRDAVTLARRSTAGGRAATARHPGADG